MKLIFCRECGDIYNIDRHIKNCSCRKTQGQYVDNKNAWYSGPVIPLGFDNRSFESALLKRPDCPPGELFTAFVIEHNCKTFMQRTDRKEEKTFNYIDIHLGTSYEVTNIHGLWMRFIHGKWEYYNTETRDWSDYEVIDNTLKGDSDGEET